MRLSLSSWGQESLREECLEAKQRAVAGSRGPLFQVPPPRTRWRMGLHTDHWI